MVEVPVHQVDLEALVVVDLDREPVDWVQPEPDDRLQEEAVALSKRPLRHLVAAESVVYSPLQDLVEIIWKTEIT